MVTYDTNYIPYGSYVMFPIQACKNYYFEFTVLTAMSEKNKNILKKDEQR